MPWVTDSTVLAAVASVHRFASAASAPAHWAAHCAAANVQAYNRIRRVLLQRGFAAADLDAWSEREEFNTRGALCNALRRLGLPEGAEGLSLSNYCKVWDELDALQGLFDEGGEEILPVRLTASIGTGATDTRTGPRVTAARQPYFGSDALDDPLDGAL